MNASSIGLNWPLVNENDFKEFLKTCPDYVRDSYVGGADYRFRHNRTIFAVVRFQEGKELIAVAPDQARLVAKLP